MQKSNDEKKRSRWNGGLPRYSAEERTANNRMREQHGWHRGARIAVRPRGRG